MQVSAHAKARMEERLSNYSSTEKPVKVFETALRYGKRVSDFYGDFKSYLEQILTKQHGTDIRVYADNVFVFETRKMILITVWNIPPEYEPYKNYLNVNRSLVDKEFRAKQKEEAKILKEALKNGYSYYNFKNTFDDYLASLCNEELNVIVYNNNIYLYDKNKELLVDTLEIPDYYQPYESFMRKEDEIDMTLEDVMKLRPSKERNKQGKDSQFAEYDKQLAKLGLRECRHCNKTLPIDQFKPRGKGYYPYCNECSTLVVLERKGVKPAKTKSKPTPTKATTTTTSTDVNYDLGTIKQVMGFKEYLQGHDICEAEFIPLVKNKHLLEALDIYEHLTDASKQLYVDMCK